MLLSDCKREMALWCLNNKVDLENQFDGPGSLAVVEYLNCLDPKNWEIKDDEGDEADFNCHSFNTGKPCSSNTCADCVGCKVVVSKGDTYNTYYGVAVGSIIRQFELIYLEGQLRGSVITDPTDTNVVSVEARGE